MVLQVDQRLGLKRIQRQSQHIIARRKVVGAAMTQVAGASA
jgi:hypothetical protein